MNYEETIAYIHATPKFSRILGNDLLRRLLGYLGDPQKTLSFIHVAGTNGKGSVCAMTAQILQEAGLRTGLFTSPYIERFNERIQINGACIPDDELARIATTVRTVMEENHAFVSEFALDTAIAFLYFKEQKCDIVVLETGMGGRLDATNVIDNSLVSAITSISLDHTQYLGETIEKIALEKCGIIKPGTVVVTYPDQHPAALAVIRKACRELRSPLIECDFPQILKDGFCYQEEAYTLGLGGEFQPYNACMAIEIIHILRKAGFFITQEQLKAGLRKTIWPGRFEFISERLVIDGGHNPDGLVHLKRSLLGLRRRVSLVVAMMEDKALEEAVAILSQITDDITVTQVNMPRCTPAAVLAALFLKHSISCRIETRPEIAVQKALAGSKDLVCVCGSLYLAGDVRKWYNKSAKSL